MKKKSPIYWLIALYFAFAILYFLFFIFEIENFPLFIVLTISSATILSSTTVYTVSQSISKREAIKFTKGRHPHKKESDKYLKPQLIEDYFEAMPIIDQYANSLASFDEIYQINDYIFTEFDQEDLIKIDLLKLSKMDKIFFLREMLYFEKAERKKLINQMIKYQDEPDDKTSHNPTLIPFSIEDKIRIYVRSLIETGEKTRIIIIEKSDFIKELKEKISVLFNYKLDDFVLSTGGILMDEKLQIKDYNIEDDDEIALIPSRKIKK